MDKQKRFLLRFAWLAAIAIVVWAVVKYLLVWLLPFALALGLAAATEPVMEAVRRKMRLRRGFLAAVFTLVLVGGLTALTVAAVGQLLRQAEDALDRLPLYLSGLPRLADSLLQRLDRVCANCPAPLRQDVEAFLNRLPEQLTDAVGALSAALLRWAGSLVAALPNAVLFCATTALAVFFTLSSYPAIAGFARRQLTEPQRRWVRGLRENLFAALGHWLRAQAILLAITFCQLLAGFLLLRQPYAVLLAFLIALIDALPVFGTGTVLVPWALLLFLVGNVPRGLALTALYAVIYLVRTVLEPKLVGARSDLPPLAALAAMYVGFRTMGVGGMVVMPMAALVIKQLHDAGYVKIWR